MASVRFSPSSLQLLASSLDSAVRLWDVANARVIKTYTSHTNTQYAGAALFLFQPGPDSRVWVACGSEDRQVYVWDLQTKRVVASWSAHRDAVAYIAVRPSHSRRRIPHCRSLLRPASRRTRASSFGRL